MASDIDSVIQYIHDDLLSIHAIDDISINGIQVEGSRKNILKIGTAVTASLSTIERACRDKVDLLIVHHGLLLKNRALPITGLLLKKIGLLYSHGVTLAAYHLPLDVHPSIGNAWSLPLDLGWQATTPFCLWQNSCHLGVMSILPQKMQATLLANQLISYFNPIQYQLILPKKEIQRVAFVPGQGHKYIHEAIELGADCFITGTADEPLWHIANEMGISFFSCGHHATEKRGVQKLGAHLADKYSLIHTFYDELNPF